MAEFENNDQRGDIFSKAVRAGKRTYFFDVRSTRNNEYYLTITESKRRFTEGSERPFFEKHKIFLYREDFEKFIDGLKEAVDHIQVSQPDYVPPSYNHQPARENINSATDNHQPASDNREPSSGFSNLEFDDLGK
jgi:hypothetical protein